MSNYNVDEIQEPIIMFEEDYQDVKKNTNYIWLKYEDKIKRIINGLSYWKNFDSNELMQQSYIYFVDLCKIYDPYYNNGFIPFDKFLFKNLITKLRAHIQRFYFKQNREQPIEFTEYTSRNYFQNNINDADGKIYIEYIYSLISDRQQKVLELFLKGYKQREIGEMLQISQSRVSVIKKKTLLKLQEILENKGKLKKKSKKVWKFK